MQNIIIHTLLGLSIALWIWTLMDVAESRFEKLNNKIIWLLLIFLLPILGAIFYFKLKRK